MLDRTTDRWKEAGFGDFKPVQKRVIPLMMNGSDVLVESPTGTGKTLAYLIPVIEKMDIEKKLPQTIILAPSKELAMQILDVAQVWGKPSGIRAASIIGGANPKRQLEKLKKQPHILIGTPGRILELIKQKKIKTHEVKTLVLDEVDQLFLPEHTQAISDIIKSTLADQRQLAMFSATLPKEIEDHGKSITKNAEVIRVERDASEAANVAHQYMVCESREKIDLIRRIVRMDSMKKEKSLAFMREVRDVLTATEKLNYKNLEIAPLHSDLSKEERAASMRKFRSGDLPLMLATDVATRGLDIQDVTYVIHMDAAEDLDQYIHRSGRTGRAGASGTVLSFVSPMEVKQMKRYARELNVELKEVSIQRGDWQFVD
ncbi:DEAD/DEAH box helicase [Jeotgalibacillus campisalis]|uniref:RNA helicase n=1 Tax=Jeotgalibacillus campisalis TaxID=220754 RepID=A0A0C2VSW6_9BACL|nr:DEAD/DEAH box helicase [Jeotgalibacillus campisalis]KIL47083.1 hypothetical protein KR50_24050 [Jeotgalibacillus campisalis]